MKLRKNEINKCGILADLRIFLSFMFYVSFYRIFQTFLHVKDSGIWEKSCLKRGWWVKWEGSVSDLLRLLP